MHPIAKITDKDIGFIYTPVLAIDALWEHYYGRDIEYQHRLIPPTVAYLVRKYGKVPHWLLLETVAENLRVGDESADALIADSIEFNMISVWTPEGDRRQRFYGLSQEQKDKLMTVRKGEALAYLLAGEQVKQPENLEAGLTSENKPWYRNAMQRVLRHDDRFERNMTRIKKLGHLILAFTLVVMASSWVTAVYATADKGGN